jgi:hypothetical protein
VIRSLIWQCRAAADTGGSWRIQRGVAPDVGRGEARTDASGQAGAGDPWLGILDSTRMSSTSPIVRSWVMASRSGR